MQCVGSFRNYFGLPSANSGEITEVIVPQAAPPGPSPSGNQST